MKIKIISASVLILFSVMSCVSVKDLAMDSAADILTSGSGGMNVFTSDDDPQLIADALPLAMKLYEMILSSRPERADLQFETGKNFIMYANAFIQTPAGMLPDEDFLEQKEMLSRAKKMYLRGRDYVMTGIGLAHPGFETAIKGNCLDDAFLLTDNAADAAMLYWAASGWIAAYSCDPFDFNLASELYIPTAMLFQALKLNPALNNGAIHDVLIQIYSSLPSSHVQKALATAPNTVGSFYKTYYAQLDNTETNQQKALYHFNESIKLSNGLNPGTFISYAQAVSVKNQDYAEYKNLLDRALSIDAEAMPENKLVITIYRNKARWLLEHADNYFILDTDPEAEE